MTIVVILYLDLPLHTYFWSFLFDLLSMAAFTINDTIPQKQVRTPKKLDEILISSRGGDGLMLFDADVVG